MSEPQPLQIVSTTVRTIDANTVFFALSDETRRQILVSLFDSQWHRVSGFCGTLPKHRDLLRKHCDVLAKSGLVETKLDPADERRRLYRLSPSVKTTTSSEGRTMDFGCCILRC